MTEVEKMKAARELALILAELPPEEYELFKIFALYVVNDTPGLCIFWKMMCEFAEQRCIRLIEMK